MINALKPDWTPSDCTSDTTYHIFGKFIINSYDLQCDEVSAQNEFYKNTELPKIVDLLLPFDDEA